MKASDVFAQAEYVFSKKVPFREAFPQIEDMQIEVNEKGAGVDSWLPEDDGPRRYTMSNLPGEYINCSNPLCYNGGFSVGDLIREMIREQKSTLKASRVCQGYEGSPKGRRKYRKCVNSFTVTIRVVYKPAQNTQGQISDENSPESR
jgi:hypothetical protein